MIRFTAENRFWKHPQRGRGLFVNVEVVPVSQEIETDIGTGNKRLTVKWNAITTVGENKEVIGSGQLIFTNEHVPTIVQNDDGENQEIISYLSGGGTYDPVKVVVWGWPSFDRVMGYFKKESVWTGLEFAQSPFIQLAIDWVKYNTPIDGEKILITGFNYNPTTP